MKIAGSQIQKAAQQWASAQNLDLQKLDPKQQQAVIADVAKSTQASKLDVMNELVAVWSKTNEDRGAGLEKAGGGWAYQGLSAQRSVGSSPLGAFMSARLGDNINAAPKGKRLDDAAIDKLGADTTKTAAQALGIADFSERNTLHADVVANETATLAAASTGKDASLLKGVFQNAARAAGAEFAAAFTPEGAKILENEGLYKTAMKAAGGIAFEAMKTLASNATDIVARSEIADLATMVAGDLGIDIKLDNKKLKTNLMSMTETLLKGDWFLNPDDAGKTALDRIPDAAEGAPLSSHEANDLNVGIRLANATWKSGQVHRAAWEGTNKRVDPEQKTAYHPFDKLKREMFDKSVSTLIEAGTPPALAQELAFSRVVFEVFKDLDQLKGAIAN